MSQKLKKALKQTPFELKNENQQKSNEKHNLLQRSQYATVRNYMIDFIGAKIKQPRKSHIKKDPEAQADFLKLT